MFTVREIRSHHGGVRLLAERALYLELMSQGVSTAEACKVVGINRKTGLRWRVGRSDKMPNGKRIETPPIGRPVSDRYLSEEERILLADLMRSESSLRSIARALGRSPSTVSREITRNSHPTSGKYLPQSAQLRAERRRPRPKAGKLAANAELRVYVQLKLERRWSPQQIAARIRVDYPDRGDMRIVHETIYQSLYRNRPEDLDSALLVYLRSRRQRRRRRRHPALHQRRFVAPMVMIADRLGSAEDRREPGHWEGDLIVGRASRSAIATLVERTSRYVVLVHLGRGHGAEHVRARLENELERIPSHLRRSMTWDQGSEMGRHHEFTQSTGMPVYFCDRASPWQRGTNENTNGLLRQYFPKYTDLALHDAVALRLVADELNDRPRASLGWRSPTEVFLQLSSGPAVDVGA